MKKIISILAVIAVIGVAAVGFMFMSYSSDVKGGKGSDEAVTVQLDKGMGAYSVAAVLAENGIVENELFFKLYHRALALSENAWSDEDAKKYSDFEKRLQRHKYYADELGIYYGADEITMRKNEVMKGRIIKKLGISFKDFDCEYKVNKYFEKR